MNDASWKACTPMSGFDLAGYLARVDLAGVPLTVAGLAALQSAQLHTIPFENIDPLLGIEPSVSLRGVYRKMIHGGRGGYCHELNTLLGGALDRLGFEAQRTLARVRRGSPTAGSRSHLVWTVTVDGRRFLVDSGFGGPGALEPLEIDTEGEQARPNGVYRMRPDMETSERIVEQRTEIGWFALYGFDGAYASDADIVAANHLSSNWSESVFPGNLMLNAYRHGVRIGVFNQTLTEERLTGVQRREFGNYDDFREVLAGRLGLPLSPAQLQAVWRRIDTKARPPESAAR